MSDLSRLEEEFLVCEALGIERTDLISHPELKDSKDPKLAEFMNRKENHEPLAYITGYQPFMGLKFFVNQHVLIPRPETELLVEEVIKLCVMPDLIGHPDLDPSFRWDDTPKILDIGCGSGAIAVSLKKQLPKAEVTAVDISEEALSIAKENAKFHDVEIKFLQSDLFSSVINEKFDIIVSNPPYIPSDEIERLAPTVKNFEPRLALDGGKDGLDVIRKIIAQAKDHLKPNGILIFEIGFGQAEEVKNILSSENYQNIKIIKDYAGIERIVMASPHPVL